MLRRIIKEIWRVAHGSPNPLGWYWSGRAPVPRGVAHSRAAACVNCPKNGKGPLTQWFTKRAAEVIGREIEKRSDRDMTTHFDGALGVCEVCYCPLKLKVHEPIDLVLKHLSPEEKTELWHRCWISHEESQLNQQQ